MSYDETLRAELLTERERSALEVARDLYGAEAKLAAAALASQLGLTDEVQRSFTSAIAGTLGAMEFDGCREVAERLRDLSTVLGLGGTAYSGYQANGNGRLSSESERLLIQNAQLVDPLKPPSIDLVDNIEDSPATEHTDLDPSRDEPVELSPAQQNG